jgi:hypothetical protein
MVGINQNSTQVSLSVFDSLGRNMAPLINEYHAPGNYSTQLDASKCFKWNVF